MPKLHNPDWNALQLSDFPQFKCLCELCDCGCFERGKKKHSIDCKKHIDRISNAFESAFINKPKIDSSTCYSDAYKMFEVMSPSSSLNSSRKSESSTLNENLLSKSSSMPLKLEFPAKLGPKADCIELIDKNAKFSVNTTNKEHFKPWNSDPAKPASEHPELSGRLIYPENKRRFRTTNEEMYLKNYGSHYMAQSTAVNQFEQTFKLNQGKMNLNTVYHNDFKKQASNGYKERPVKREHMEARHQKVITEKLPMESLTQHKFDFKSYDPQIFSSVSLNNFGTHCDLFKSRLNKSLNPRDEENMTSSINNFGSTSTLSKTTSVEKLPNDMVTYRNNRNIKFITTFDNRQLPKLRVIRDLSNNSSKQKSSLHNQQNSPAASMAVVDVNDDDDDDDDVANTDRNLPKLSTYRNDFRDRGFEVCMAKAYNILASIKTKPTTITMANVA